MRENRVPYYQRLFQAHDGKRQWWKVSHIFVISRSIGLPCSACRSPAYVSTSCCLALVAMTIPGTNYLSRDEPGDDTKRWDARLGT